MLVKDIKPGPSASSPVSLVDVNGTLFFVADDAIAGVELWKSDGTAAGTTLVKDINPGPSASSPGALASVNDMLLFFADDGTNGRELWKSDGTAAGTTLVKDINAGHSGSSPFSLTNVNGTLFLTANDGITGTELWKSDGTTIGTMLVADIYPGPFGSAPGRLTNVNGTLFLAADHPTSGRELWKSDGTLVGTTLVKDINSRLDPGPQASSPNWLTDVNGLLFFAATDGINGQELWRSDGTEANTTMVKNLIDGSNSSASLSPDRLTNVNGTLFFRSANSSTGAELWKSDGTAAGTVLVKDINAGGGSSHPSQLTNMNGTLFFSAVTSAEGAELWKSNGTTAGTTLVKDINPGGENASPSALTNTGGTLFFSATNGFIGGSGSELWKSDGTEAGTTLAQDINPGSASSSPSSLANVATSGGSSTLFFSADDGANGVELWKASPSG